MSKARKCIVAKPTPGHENRFELGKKWIKNPYDDPKNPEIEVQINTRHDILEHWKARRSIEEAQYAAGFRLQIIWQQASIGPSGALQYGKDKVDGTGGGDPFADRFLAATGQLREISAFLGMADYALTVRLVCEGYSISEVATAFYGDGKLQRDYVSKRVKEALGYLADFWGSEGKQRVPMRVEHYISAA